MRLDDRVTVSRSDLTLFHQPVAAKILGALLPAIAALMIGGGEATVGVLLASAGALGALSDDPSPFLPPALAIGYRTSGLIAVAVGCLLAGVALRAPTVQPPTVPPDRLPTASIALAFVALVTYAVAVVAMLSILWMGCIGFLDETTPIEASTVTAAKM